MAPRFSSAVKIVPGLVLDGFLNAIIRRGYTAEAMAMAASERVTSTSAGGGVLPAAGSDGVMKKEESERSTTEKAAAAWMPDPVTGYYRPENYVDEMDPVDLRDKLLKARRNTIN